MWQLPDGLKGLPDLSFLERTLLNAFRFHMAHGLDIDFALFRLILYDVALDCLKRPDGTYRKSDLSFVREASEYRRLVYDELLRRFRSDVEAWEAYRRSRAYDELVRRVREIPDGSQRFRAGVELGLAYLYMRYQIPLSRALQLYGRAEQWWAWRVAATLEKGWVAVFSRKWVFALAFLLTVDWNRVMASLSRENVPSDQKLPWFARKWVDPAIRPLAAVYEEILLPLASEFVSTFAAEALRQATNISMLCFARFLVRLAMYHPALSALRGVALAVELTRLVAVHSPFAFFGWQIAFEWPLDGLFQHAMKPVLRDLYLMFKLREWGKVDSLQKFGRIEDRIFDRFWRGLKEYMSNGGPLTLKEQLSGWIEQLSEGARFVAELAWKVLEGLNEFVASSTRQTSLVPKFLQPYVDSLFALLSYHGRALFAKHVHESSHVASQMKFMRAVQHARAGVEHYASRALGSRTGFSLRQLIANRADPSQALVRLCQSGAAIALDDWLLLESGTAWTGWLISGPSHVPFDVEVDGFLCSGHGQHGPFDPLKERPEDAGLKDPASMRPGETASSSSPYSLFKIRYEYYINDTDTPDIVAEYSAKDTFQADEMFLQDYPSISSVPNIRPFYHLRFFDLLFHDPRVFRVQSQHTVCWVPVLAPTSARIAQLFTRNLKARVNSCFASAVRSFPRRRIAIHYCDLFSVLKRLKVSGSGTYRTGYMSYYKIRAHVHGMRAPVALGYITACDARIYTSQFEFVCDFSQSPSPSVHLFGEAKINVVELHSDGTMTNYPLQYVYIREQRLLQQYPAFKYDDYTRYIPRREVINTSIVMKPLELVFFASQRQLLRTPSRRSKVIRVCQAS